MNREVLMYTEPAAGQHLRLVDVQTFDDDFPVR